MGEIVEIKGRRFFTLDEAKALMPVVRRITSTAAKKVELISARFSATADPKTRGELEARLKGVLDEWQSKISRLGCETKGIWLVDFDSGEGYYCWHYPEPELSFFHGYAEGFRGRKRLP